MLDRIQINGFRALARTDVPLKPLTVLIGQNDSGKSSFLSAVALLANGAALDPFDHHDGDTKTTVVIRGEIPGQQHVERVDDTFRSRTHEHDLAMLPCECYVLPSEGVEMESGGLQAGVVPLPGRSGQSVAAILDALLRSDRKRFDQIESVIRAHLPGIESLSIETPQPSGRRLDLVFQGGFKMPASRASTGARLMIFFITLAYHPSPPKLILLEEPENGVHPQRLKQIMALLREITEGKHGKHAAQIIMTTHSPYLLDYVDPSKDQVIVFRRNEAGERTAEAVDTERLRGFLSEFMLGEVWYNQGEEGLIKRAG